LKKWLCGISHLYFYWPQFILAKNLPKGEIVGYLCIGFTFAKTNIQACYWILCSGFSGINPLIGFEPLIFELSTFIFGKGKREKNP